MFSFGPHKDALLTVARVDYYYPFRHPVLVNRLCERFGEAWLAVRDAPGFC